MALKNCFTGWCLWRDIKLIVNLTLWSAAAARCTDANFIIFFYLLSSHHINYRFKLPSTDSTSKMENWILIIGLQLFWKTFFNNNNFDKIACSLRFSFWMKHFWENDLVIKFSTFDSDNKQEKPTSLLFVVHWAIESQGLSD